MAKNQMAYEQNKSAKVGETIRCACCGKEFVKKQYSQAFCCGECKDKFWNRRGDRHKKGYYKKYDKLHPERIERAKFFAGGYGETEAEYQYRTNEEFREYVNESYDLYDGAWGAHSCYVDLETQWENFCGIE